MTAAQRLCSSSRTLGSTGGVKAFHRKARSHAPQADVEGLFDPRTISRSLVRQVVPRAFEHHDFRLRETPPDSPEVAAPVDNAIAIPLNDERRKVMLRAGFESLEPDCHGTHPGKRQAPRLQRILLSLEAVIDRVRGARVSAARQRMNAPRSNREQQPNQKMSRRAHQWTKEHELVDPRCTRAAVDDRLHEHGGPGRVAQSKDRTQGHDRRDRRLEGFYVVGEIVNVRALACGQAMAREIDQYHIESAIEAPAHLVAPERTVLEEAMNTNERTARRPCGEALYHDVFAAHFDAPDLMQSASGLGQAIVSTVAVKTGRGRGRRGKSLERGSERPPVEGGGARLRAARFS